MPSDNDSTPPAAELVTLAELVAMAGNADLNDIAIEMRFPDACDPDAPYELPVTRYELTKYSSGYTVIMLDCGTH